jgi:hypothetical protein
MQSPISILLLGFTLVCSSVSLGIKAETMDSALDQLAHIYQQELRSTQGCGEPRLLEFAVC